MKAKDLPYDHARAPMARPMSLNGGRGERWRLLQSLWLAPEGFARGHFLPVFPGRLSRNLHAWHCVGHGYVHGSKEDAHASSQHTACNHGQ